MRNEIKPVNILVYPLHDHVTLTINVKHQPVAVRLCFSGCCENSRTNKILFTVINTNKTNSNLLL